MDFDDIGNRLANLTMYDVKQFYTAAKNYALNISDIEAKVNEATSDDPWGASSTLMQEIAQATNNFQDFNEIMPAIYRNFMEREASEWRQIYKALQLLEYIIKHGSERVVDDARSHLGTIKILRNFHYIDEAAKDQGINVRNRAKEIAELLNDVDRIRAERRKARSNKSKYQGASNADFVPGSGTGRYGGFGSDSFYASDGAAGGGGGSSSARRSSARDSFEAYDAGDDDDGHTSSSARPSRRTTASNSARAPAPAKKEEKVADLFSFDDDEPDAPSASSVATASAAKGAADGFDDFDDFQGAPAQTVSKAPAKPTTAPPKASASNVFDFFGDDEAPSTAPAVSAKPASSMGSAATPLQPQRNVSSSAVPSAAGNGAGPTKAAGSSAFNFDDLWTSSSSSTGAGTSNAAGGKQKLSMAEMAKQKSSSAVWGGNAQQQQQGSATKAKDPFDFL